VPHPADGYADRRTDGGQPGAFGALLRGYREAAGLSQEALAEKAGLCWTLLSRQ